MTQNRKLEITRSLEAVTKSFKMKLTHCILAFSIGIAANAKGTAAKNDIAIGIPDGVQLQGWKQGILDLANFSCVCEEAADITISLPTKTLTFTMDKCVHPINRNANAREGFSSENTFMSGEENNGSTLNLLCAKDGQIFGSITDTDEDTVTQIGVDADGNPYFDIIPSSEFPSEAEPHDILDLMIDDSPPKERLLFDINETSSTTRRVNTDMATIDVLVVWTKAAECANAQRPLGCTLTSSTSQTMLRRVELAIEETNVAYEKSGVAIRLELVYSYRSETYDEPASGDGFITTLGNLRNKNDGKLDEVHHYRELYGADVVAMIIENPAYCGVGKCSEGTFRFVI